ncbi:hypothetical protein HKBW3S47_01610 [Candidatus Hakubella thermalkaliphila]|uniref:Band 7 domain-containing protein n=1 Tax=Candidatus Hakubella thermalkaliphila TaxID=2754717 RepID=A0A6V8Q5W1_9ACTN|nr:hypothetical protein HKBW3S47_01610 [Candidatus Hakubella thermalkaliphila]
MGLSAWSLQGEAKLVKEPLALTHSQRDAVMLLKMMRKQHPIPEVLVVVKVSGQPKQIISQLLKMRSWELGRTSGPFPILQAGQSIGEQPPYPILDASWRVAVNFGRFIAALSAQDVKNNVQPMIISSLPGSEYFVFNTSNKSFRIGNTNPLHWEPPPGSQYSRMLNYAQVFMTLHIVLSAVVIVRAGTVGVLTEFGRTTGVVFEPGLHFRIPLIQNVVIYSTRKVIYEASAQPDQSRANYTDFTVDTTSSDGQQIQINYTLRFYIDKSKAVWIYNNIGNMDDVAEKVVKTETRSLVRNIPKGYTAAQLYGIHVFEVQEQISQELDPRFAANGVVMDEFLLRKIDFTAEYFETLEEKQIAEERIEIERNNLEQEKIRKEQTIVKAEAEAQALRIKGQALRENPQIIQLEFVTRMAPNIKWGILPETGVIPFLDITQQAQETGQPLVPEEK